MKLAPQCEAIRQFRLWEDSGFDPIVIRRLRRRSEDRDAERTRRRLLSPFPRGVLSARLKELRAWQAAEAERIAILDAEWQRQEAILRDPEATDKEKAAARLAIAGRMYRETRKEFPEDEAKGAS